MTMTILQINKKEERGTQEGRVSYMYIFETVNNI